MTSRELKAIDGLHYMGAIVRTDLMEQRVRLGDKAPHALTLAWLEAWRLLERIGEQSKT